MKGAWRTRQLPGEIAEAPGLEECKRSRAMKKRSGPATDWRGSVKSWSGGESVSEVPFAVLWWCWRGPARPPPFWPALSARHGLFAPAGQATTVVNCTIAKRCYYIKNKTKQTKVHESSLSSYGIVIFNTCVSDSPFCRNQDWSDLMARFVSSIIFLMLMATLIVGCGGGGGGANNSNVGGGGTISTYAVSGSVLSSSGSALPGATVTLSGASAITATTNASGAYTFTGAANGSYTLSISMSGYTFSPASISVVINGGNATVQNFVGTANPQTYSISGMVTGGGSALPGATMVLAGASTIFATTDANGAYTFTGIVNGTYTLSAVFAGYTWSPTSIQVVVNNGNVTGQNFAGTGNPQAYSISGTVSSGSLPLPGVTVTLTGLATRSITTGANGVYAFSGVANGTYTLSAGLNGYTFSPASAQVVVNNGSIIGQNFAGTANPQSTYSTITGTVTSGGSALPGATVELLDTLLTTTTNSSGTYTFSNVAGGTYTLSVYLNGYAFSPTSSTVILNGGLISVNFVGTASSQTYSISGTVANSGHIALSGATVKLSGSGSSITTTTNSYGAYTLSGVSSGVYTLSVTASGLNIFNNQQVTVTGNLTGVNFVAI
jgi:hypothetical protein